MIDGGVIDLHTHLHPPRLFAAIRRWFAQRTSWDLASQPMEPQAVAAVLRENGVRHFVFCSYAHKPGMARDLNAWLVEQSRTLGGYGLPLATVHLDDADCAGDVRTALNDGCIGLKIHEDVQGLACDDPRFEPIYAELAARGRFVLAHVGPIPWSYPPGAGLARVRRVLERHPGLNFVVAHFGAPDSREYLDLMNDHPRLYLDTTMAFAAPSPMRVAVDAASIVDHRERIVYGTDFPNIPYAYGSERAALERLNLDPGTLRAVLCDNAARLLGQGVPAENGAPQSA